MRIISSLLFAILTLCSLPAFASPAPYYNLVDCSISSLSGSSQQIVAANPNRQYLMLFNSGANTAYVNLTGGTAASSGASSVALGVGASVVISGQQIATNKVTITGTAAQPFTCYEGR